MIITISGDPGSGKSTVAKAIARKLKLTMYSAGDFMREMAKERGITLLELSKQAESGPEIDKEIDERTKELAGKKDNFVIDSRLAWYFIPNSIKIYLKCDINESAKRIFKQKRGSVEAENITQEDTKAGIMQRKDSEKKRYKEYYDIDLDAESNYDFILDTTKLTVEESVKAVLDFLKKAQDLN